MNNKSIVNYIKKIFLCGMLKCNTIILKFIKIILSKLILKIQNDF